MKEGQSLSGKVIAGIIAVVAAIVIGAAQFIGSGAGQQLWLRVFPQQGAVEGYVQWQDGTPAKDLMVVRDHEFNWNSYYLEDDGRFITHTNSQGHFILTGVDAGSHTILVYQFMLSNGDYVPDDIHSDSFYLPPGNEKLTLPLIVFE